MDKKQEAKELLTNYLNKYRSYPYPKIASMNNEKWSHTDEIITKSGRKYQVAFHVFSDDRSLGTIRVSGSIYDIDDRKIKKWQFWKLFEGPLVNDDFIIAPDGSFIDED